jgi:hypothetical protein
MSIPNDNFGFGLDDGAASRPFPELDQLAQVGDSIMNEVLDVVEGSPIEDHRTIIYESFIGGLHMAATRIERQGEKARADIKRLMRDFDGGEIADTELQAATALARNCDAAVEAMETMRDAAAKAYETATGDVWKAYQGSVKASRATAAMIDAKDALRAHRAAKHQATTPGAQVVAFRGSTDAVSAEDAGRIYDALNFAKSRFPDMALATTGLKGAEQIALKWAKQNRVTTILAKANFEINGRSAPFKANREIMELDPVHVFTLASSLSGVAEEATPFGPALNLAEEARKAGIPHIAIMAKRPAV